MYVRGSGLDTEIMDLNGASNPTNTRTQPSIRSFFQPRTPQYSAPPQQPPISSQPPLCGPSKPSITMPPIPTPPPASEPSNAPSKQPPEQALILPIQQDHIQPLRRINSLLLPISYPDSFYHQILSTPTTLSRAILWDQKTIGGIIVRLDPSPTPQPPGTYDIYIQSLALLSPYRGKGLAEQALESVIEAAVNGKEKVRELYAHVWTENHDALEWYVKRGFRREEGVVQGYYRRLKPDTAWIFRRTITPSDHLAHTSSTLHTSLEQIPATVTPREEGPRDRPGNVKHTKSFQDRRPDVEWNDLPEDVLGNGFLKPSSEVASTATSRSSSRSGMGKKKRQYPAAAFGS